MIWIFYFLKLFFQPVMQSMTWSVIHDPVHDPIPLLMVCVWEWELWKPQTYLKQLNLVALILFDTVWSTMLSYFYHYPIALYNDWNKTYNVWNSQLPGGRPVGSLHSTAEEFNLGWLRTNPTNGREEDLNPGLLDYKHPNHSATLPPSG